MLGARNGRWALGLWLLSVVPLTGCSGGIRAQGIVQALDALPIESADLVLVRPGDKTFYGHTNHLGCFRIGGALPPGRHMYSLVTTAPGYKAVTADVKALDYNYVVVTLSPIASAANSTASVTRDWERTKGKPCSQ